MIYYFNWYLLKNYKNKSTCSIIVINQIIKMDNSTYININIYLSNLFFYYCELFHHSKSINLLKQFWCLFIL